MLTTNLVRSLVVFASFLVMGCAMAKSMTASLSVGTVQVSAKLGKVSINGATQARFVHAELTLDDKVRRLKSVNLSCITLTIEGTASDEINVDSIASVLTNPYRADANGQVRVPMYWVFSAQNSVDDRSLSAAKLGIKSDTSSCFHY